MKTFDYCVMMLCVGTTLFGSHVLCFERDITLGNWFNFAYTLDFNMSVEKQQ